LENIPQPNIRLLSSIYSAFTLPNAEEIGFATFISEHVKAIKGQATYWWITVKSVQKQAFLISGCAISSKRLPNSAPPS
jgi:hypothetical protein